MVSNTEFCESAFISTSSSDIFWYVGCFFILFIITKFIRSLWRGIYTCFIADLFGLTVNWKKLGSWAVVTGSTDGIGKAYAKALAAKSFNIVLISRTEEKLKNVAREIEQKFGVKTKIVAVDFTNDVFIYDEIRKNIEKLEIGVLVNNVGMSYKYAEYITKVEDSENFAENLIRANITSVTRMTQIVLPYMVKQHRGVIINLSSLTAVIPIPLLSIYSASKAYVNYFTRATQEEYKAKGIIIQSVLPGLVATNMTKVRPSLQACLADDFVRWALKTVGVEDKTYGYPVHKIQGYMQELCQQYLPENLNLVIGHNVMGKIRKHYYKKYGIVDKEEESLIKN